MINTTFENGRSLRQLIVGVSFFLAFSAIRKSLKYVNFRLTTNQDLFQARSSVNFGESLASALHLRLRTARIFLFAFLRDQNILMKTFLPLTSLLSALFYASKQLIAQAPPIMP